MLKSREDHKMLIHVGESDRKASHMLKTKKLFVGTFALRLGKVK